jgi:hypothetical protein
MGRVARRTSHGPGRVRVAVRVAGRWAGSRGGRRTGRGGSGFTPVQPGAVRCPAGGATLRHVALAVVSGVVPTISLALDSVAPPAGPRTPRFAPRDEAVGEAESRTRPGPPGALRPRGEGPRGAGPPGALRPRGEGPAAQALRARCVRAARAPRRRPSGRAASVRRGAPRRRPSGRAASVRRGPRGAGPPGARRPCGEGPAAQALRARGVRAARAPRRRPSGRAASVRRGPSCQPGGSERVRAGSVRLNS